MKDKLSEIKKKYVESKADAKEQFRDGLISRKEMEEQISWAYADMAREMELWRKGDI